MPDGALHRGTGIDYALRLVQPYLDNPAVTEITTNTPGTLCVQTFAGWTVHDAPWLDAAAIEGMVNALAAYNGISRAPIMYVNMPHHRGTIVQPPACLEGQISVTIRKHDVASKSLETLDVEGAFSSWRSIKTADLVRLEPFEEELLALLAAGRVRDFLTMAVLHKRNIVISGAFGSGKTTFARALAGCIPLDRRIVTLENVHELHLPHRNQLNLIYGTGKGRVSVRDIQRVTTRLTGNHTIMGEISGAEAWEFFMGLNIGSRGGITTIHANSARETWDRIISLLQMSEAGRGLPLSYSQGLLKATLDIVLHFHERKLVEVLYDPVAARMGNAAISGGA